MSMNDRLSETRQEKINGEIIMMSPSTSTNHGIIAGNIYTIFRKYLKGKHCRAFADGHDVHFDEDNTVIPDAMIVCNKDRVKHDGIYGAPDLIVEVLSPSTARHDKLEKKALYEKHGVKEYWIIHPADKSIEVYLLKDKTYGLDNVYTIFPDWQWARMTDEERGKVALTLKVSLYDDLIIGLEEIFEDVE